MKCAAETQKPQIVDIHKDWLNRYSVFNYDRRVIISFPEHVGYLHLNILDARKLGEALIEFADQLNTQLPTEGNP